MISQYKSFLNNSKAVELTNLYLKKTIPTLTALLERIKEDALFNISLGTLKRYISFIKVIIIKLF